MKSEEILQRDAEYRAIREALGAYNVALDLATRPADDTPSPLGAAAPGSEAPASAPALPGEVDPPAARA
jgi:hypothetical protein